MAANEARSFRTLREWDGAQSRAFEELSYQLLKGTVPDGAQPIRTGNPDGGVEWYATLPDGTEWGWQAKHYTRFDALLGAMTKSVRRVAHERPQLRRLTFVISLNLTTGTKGGTQKSQRRKYEDQIGVWKKDIPGADQIDFELIQASDLLDELAKPEHRGRRWFWWDEVVLGADWMDLHHQQQADAAGEKYRPDLQVDVPIEDDLIALGCGQASVAEFEGLRRELVSAVDDLGPWNPADDPDAARLYAAIWEAAKSVKEALLGVEVRASDIGPQLESVPQQIGVCQDAVYELDAHERGQEAAWRELPADDPARAMRPSSRTDGYAVQGLLGALDRMQSWLESSTGRAFGGGVYFLSGQAGSGKTHLLLDAVRRALDDDRPAVFLAGAQFGKGDLWGSVADQLGLGPVGGDELLQAMDSAGEAASLIGARFVVIVDALNDTSPSDFWRTHLPALRAAVARYPNVALAVSCRDTYEELVLAEGERKLRSSLAPRLR